jgi:hypothetical protein
MRELTAKSVKRTAEIVEAAKLQPSASRTALLFSLPAVNCWAIFNRPLSGLGVASILFVIFRPLTPWQLLEPDLDLIAIGIFHKSEGKSRRKLALLDNRSTGPLYLGDSKIDVLGINQSKPEVSDTP